MHRTPLVFAAATVAMLLWAGGFALGQESDPVLVGAGDIAACTSAGDEATASLLDGIGGTVFTLGDNVYEKGTSSEFANCYEPSWGRHKTRTYPALGNHEYETPGASGYFGYFGAAAGDPTKGYYSYDLGSWHVVVLNSNCEQVGGCGTGSPQERWLREDLKAHPAACTAAYFHHPRFSSYGSYTNVSMGPFWEALYDMGADVVLSGHSHTYERFAAQDPDGQADPAQGIRQFVVGTGGKSLHSFGTTVRANSEVRIDDTYGVLKLTLHAGGYDWEFVPVDGGTLSSDSGADRCHDPEPDAVVPEVVGVVPGEGTTGANVKANVEGTFSERMDPSTLTASTFALVKEGAAAPVSAAVSYEWATKKALLNPAADLDFGATYTAIVKGGSEGVKDLAGNPLAADKVWSFTTTTAVCTKTGTSGNDVLEGTSGDDVICGLGGSDTIKGLGGNDVLKGEGGADKLLGGPGDDTLDGGTGAADAANFSGSTAAVTASLAANTATGEGSDALAGVEGLIGSPKDDALTGSEANNTINGGSGADALDGLGGADRLTGVGGADTERGGSGNDTVVGGGGADTLKGEDGDDAIDSKDGVNGNDSLDGGLGADTKATDTTERSIVGFP